MAQAGQWASHSWDQPEAMESNTLSLGTLFQVREGSSLFEGDHRSYYDNMSYVSSSDWLECC